MNGVGRGSRQGSSSGPWGAVSPDTERAHWVPREIVDFYRRLRDEEKARHDLYPRTRLGISVKTNGAPRWPHRPDAPDPTRR